MLLAWFCLTAVIVTNVMALESDSFGRYFYDRYGNREYTSCFDNYSRTQDACRTNNNFDRSYDNSYDRTYDRSYDNFYDRSYDRTYSRTYDNRYDDRYQRDRYNYEEQQDGLYLGKGESAVYGRDVEMTCEFPYSTNIISNIGWQKLQKDYTYSTVKRWDEINDYDRRIKITQTGDNMSKVVIMDYDQRDEGVYRCTGSRARSGYRYTEAVYMEVDFKPEDSESTSYRQQYNSFDDVFEGRVAVSRPNYYNYFPN